MIAAVEGIVDDDRVAGVPGGETVQDCGDACGHCAQVSRDVGRLRHHSPTTVEDGAREVQPLLDIGRIAGAPQGYAHLLRDTGEAVAIDLQ